MNNLTLEETERMVLITEECGEVIQAIGKIQRHGFEECPPGGGLVNREYLEKELGDLLYVIYLAAYYGDIDMAKITSYRLDKGIRIGEFLHHNKPL